MSLPVTSFFEKKITLKGKDISLMAEAKTVTENLRLESKFTAKIVLIGTQITI